jgi:hypothetical protein
LTSDDGLPIKTTWHGLRFRYNKALTQETG